MLELGIWPSRGGIRGGGGGGGGGVREGLSEPPPPEFFSEDNVSKTAIFLWKNCYEAPKFTTSVADVALPPKPDKCGCIHIDPFGWTLPSKTVQYRTGLYCR